MLPLLLIIVGPTGSGKSALAVRLAERFNGELVSADSRQVYRGMDIGTAKLKPPSGVRQWLVDVASPGRQYSVAQYQRAAVRAIARIHRGGKLPILVGGTMQYVDAVVDNWRIPVVQPNAALRKKLEDEVKRKGLPALVRRLKKVDPGSAAIIDLKNARRVLRALEVAMVSKTSFVTQRRRGAPRYRVLKIGLAVSRDTLRQRLRRRAARMVRQGLLTETEHLVRRYPKFIPLQSSIGYAEAKTYLAGKISKQEMVDQIVTRTHQYARRQMTWWKRDPSIVWVESNRRATALVRSWVGSR